ncbi:MAG: formate dehydrogenase accessory sulfurtransferase FdhD [Promethearchaeota archaeon]
MFKRPVNIKRIKKNEVIDMQDTILVEQPVDLHVNSKPLSNIICLPNDLKELAMGFLYSIGIVNSTKDIKEINIDELENVVDVKLKDIVEFNIDILTMNPISRVIDTTCGISSPWRNLIKKALEDSEKNSKEKDDVKIKADIIFSSIIEMQKHTKLFRETGGCHGAAIFDFDGKLLSCKEDIGRHNAIDKVIGDLLLKKSDFSQKFLTSTGRLTGDSVLKAIRAKIPIIASLSAAVESGVRLAFAYGTTLIGFVRGARMNIYTHPYRIEV